MAPVAMGVGAIVFWIGATLIANPRGIDRLRFWSGQDSPSAATYTVWRAVGMVLVVLGIGILLGSGRPG